MTLNQITRTWAMPYERAPDVSEGSSAWAPKSLLKFVTM